jgi:hypothetical protein
VRDDAASKAIIERENRESDAKIKTFREPGGGWA